MAKWHVFPLRCVPAIRALGVCEPASNCNLPDSSLQRCLLAIFRDKLQLLIIGTNCRFFWNMRRIVAWDGLSLGTNCRFLEFGTYCCLGRIVAWDEVSLFGIWDELSLFGIWEELSLGTNRRLGRIVALRCKSLI